MPLPRHEFVNRDNYTAKNAYDTEGSCTGETVVEEEEDQITINGQVFQR